MQRLKMGIVFLTEQNFWERTKFFVKIVSWWKNELWTNEIDLSDKWKNSHFKKTNEKSRSNELDLIVNVLYH